MKKHSDEEIALMRKLTKSVNDDVLGYCVFCKKLISEGAARQGHQNFSFMPQALFVHFEGTVLRKEIGGFYCCGDCMADPINTKLIEKMIAIPIDLNTLNSEIATQLQKEALRKNMTAEFKEKVSAIDNTAKPKKEGK